MVVLRRSIITLVDTEELSRDNMPASSRKRNKGKDRKAKREESKRVLIYNTWHDWARGDMGEAVVIRCNHGLETTIPDLSHPVSSFINDYFNSVEILDTLEVHTEVLSDSHRKLAIDMLTLIGANMMLNNMSDGKEAFATLVLEKYGESQARDARLLNIVLESVKLQQTHLGTGRIVNYVSGLSRLWQIITSLMSEQLFKK